MPSSLARWRLCLLAVSRSVNGSPPASPLSRAPPANRAARHHPECIEGTFPHRVRDTHRRSAGHVCPYCFRTALNCKTLCGGTIPRGGGGSGARPPGSARKLGVPPATKVLTQRAFPSERPTYASGELPNRKLRAPALPLSVTREKPVPHVFRITRSTRASLVPRFLTFSGARPLTHYDETLNVTVVGAWRAGPRRP